MQLTADTLALSALVDLIRRGAIRDLSPEALVLATVHAEQYLIGRARFPIMTEAEAEIAIAPYMPASLEGLGSFLKKAVKSVGSAIKKVVGHVEKYALPAIAGFATGMATGNPIAAIGGAISNVAQVKMTSDQQKAATATAQAAAQGEKSAVIEQAANQLVIRIGRNPYEPAGQQLVTEYKAKLMAATDQAGLERIATEIVAQQDAASAYATANGTTDAVSKLPETIMKFLPWVLAGGAVLWVMSQQKE